MAGLLVASGAKVDAAEQVCGALWVGCILGGHPPSHLPPDLPHSLVRP